MTTASEPLPPTGPLVASPSARRRLVRNLGSLTAAAALTKVMVFVTNLAVSRLLGPDQAGRLATAQTIVMMASLLADLGLSLLTLSDIVRTPERISRLVTGTAVIQVVAAGGMSAVLAVVALAAPLPFGTGALVLVTLPLPLCLALNTAYALQAKEDMNRVAACRILSVAVTSIGSVVLVAFHPDPVGPAVMAWVGVLAADVVSAWWLWRRHHVRPVAVQPSALVASARRTVPTLQNAALLITLFVIDTLSLAVFSTARQVGLYSVGWTLCFAAEGVVILVTDASYPEMVRRWGEAADRLRSLSDQLTSLLARLTFAGAAVVSVSAPGLVALALGPSYAETATILRILVWIVPLGALSILFGFVLMSADHQRLLVRRRLVTVGAAVVGCPIAAAIGGALPVAWVIFGVTAGELVLLTHAARRLGVASVAGPALRQLDYLIVPLALAGGVALAWPGAGIAATVPVWAAAVVAVEGRRRFPTLRELAGAYRPSGAVAFPEPSTGDAEAVATAEGDATLRRRKTRGYDHEQ